MNQACLSMGGLQEPHFVFNFQIFSSNTFMCFCCFSNCNEMRKKNEEKNSRERPVDIPAIDESNACSSVCWLSI